jgi:hypothetical protein
MSPDLEWKIIARWPDWFDVQGDLRRTLMPQGFQCGDGWFELVWRLCERLEPVVSQLNAMLPDGELFEVLQVKQKMGSLRFYVSQCDAAIEAEIDAARLESLRICENCGRPGTLRNRNGWLVVFCDNCLNEVKSGA